MLPSQAGRPSSARSHMYRRTRRRTIPIVLAVIAALGVGAIVIRWMTSGGGDEDTPSKDLVALRDDKVAESKPDASRAGTKLPNSPARQAGPPAIKKPEAKPNASPTGAPAASTGPGRTPGHEAPLAPQTIRMGEPATIPLVPKAGDRPPTTPPQSPPAQSPPAKPAEQPPKESNPASGNPTKPAVIMPPAVTVTRADPDALAARPDTPARVSQRLQSGLDLVAQNKPVEARRMLTSALISPPPSGLAPAEAERARTELARLNEKLIFSPDVVPGDPFASTYAIESGDALSKLPRKLDLDVDWRFLQRINRIPEPERIQTGQRLKIITGPFSAVIDKKAFRMDLYMGSGPELVYVRSFKVGLGEYDATPEGIFQVRPKSKLIDPEWVNPRSGERFEAADPKNPIGEHWIGLVGASDNVRGLESYGIHGTIEPESIGQMRSMGCVRLLADDIALLYEVLTEGVSQVEIHGDDYP